ncbi:SurA N-terminal domain-containing protein [Pseudomonas sp. LS1212]|uniref:SurA N-terminal domain-containing protein n=1 Tax=Pseudomonas sp. LS1212 TaxID=2972478 RepID=UPI00215C3A24|nr:SurA N-terminal domain-containing protein [Pseudomonas sp. LS1212]UVJ46114.1 SurA N-terminal domain-containing protein [Pseudomonas sp. LS1212]
MKTCYWLLLVLSLMVSTGEAQEEAVAARVNGVPITVFRLERYFADYLQAQGRAVASIRNPDVYKRLRRAALDELIDKALLLEQARKQGLVVDEQAVAHQLASLRGDFGSSEVFAQRLADAGFDEASFTEYLRQEWAAQHVFAELVRVPEPTASEVEAAWAQAHPGAQAKDFSAAQNQNLTPEVERMRELAMVKEMLITQRQAQARATALKELRSRSRIELARGQ